MLQPLSSSNRVMMISLTSDELSPVELGVLTRWSIRPRLMGVDGVANVAVWGQRERQLQVQVDPARLSARDVTLEQVVRSTGNALWVSPLSYLNASTPGAGGFIETDNQRLGVRHVQPITTAEDLAEIRIEGSALRLADVADVVEGHQPLIGEANTSAGGGVLLVVERFPEADVLAVTDGVEEALAALAPGMDGVEVDTSVYRASTFIEMSAVNIGIALLLGVVATAAVLMLLGVGWRATVIAIVATAVAVTLGATAVVITGGTINTLVLAGLLGAATIALSRTPAQLSAVQRQLNESRPHDADGRGQTAAEATLTHGVGAGYVVALAFLILLPLIAVQGLSGALVLPFALAFAGTLVASVAVEFLLTPAMARIAMRPASHHPRRRARRVRRSYERGLARFGTRIELAVGVLAVLLIAVAIAVPLLRRELVPSFAERDLVVTLHGQPAGSTAQSTRAVDEMRARLLDIEGVRDVVGQVGRAVMSDQVSSVETSQLWVSLDPDAAYAPTLEAVRDAVAQDPAMSPMVETYLGQRTTVLDGAPENEVVIGVFGPTAELLEAQATTVREAVATVAGVTDAQVEQVAMAPQVEIEVDLAAAAGHGLKPGDVRRAASILVSGIEVGSLFEDQKVFDVVVWGVPALRESVERVGALLLDTPDGGQVPLSEVAAVRVVEAQSVINREGISRRLDVTATIDGDPVAISNAIAERVRSLSFPIEFHAEVDRSAIDARTARDTILGLAIGALAAAFLLLQAAFTSWRLAAIGLVAPLAAASGGIVATLLSGAVMSVGSLLGILAAAALAFALSILVLGDGRRLSAGGDASPRPRRSAWRTRSAALIVLATVPVAVVLLPFAFLRAAPGLEVIGPMAIAMLGGILASALACTLVVPTLYRWPGTRPRPRAQVAPAPTAEAEPVSPA
jgi:Cu/Ag efflux pump CusA